VSTGDLPTGHLRRRFTLGSGPLKRLSDRLQFLARLLLLCSLVAALPMSVSVGTATLAQARAEAAAQAESRFEVSAQLLEDAPFRVDASDSAPPKLRARAMWVSPGGVEREGTVIVPVAARAGSTITIWVDWEGDRKPRPLTEDDAVARAIGHAVLSYLGLALLATGAYLGFRTLLDRVRARRWAADWAYVEPVWTRQVS